ncbi:DUF1062 domain-containing protein [Anaerocolumna sp. AGMB13020]|uniref:DUF1062 domain-containing protein n=1 Tax=Anaerocolumna sp. AGMB13020 TaxID=3081750 RepID=UPI002952C47C|nr:DUF1062 domain-containing protein [Anaerocolumna sp. AGMB13020]WOO35073.1 DUF1062 domain-containing protein [Anaerocolumna sp. AGMB13020]
MSYYMILPKEAYHILRNCPKCGCGSRFISTNNFRVNANGNRIDVWLIYQCEKCRHTYNLTIYERMKPSFLAGEEYKAFLENDKEYALKYGMNKGIFEANRAHIDISNITYRLKKLKEEAEGVVVIQNPYGLKLRTDRVVAELLEISRSAAKELLKKEETNSQSYLGEETILHITVRADSR